MPINSVAPPSAVSLAAVTSRTAWWKSALANFALREFEDCGHFLAEEAPDRVVSALRDFMGQTWHRLGKADGRLASQAIVPSPPSRQPWPSWRNIYPAAANPSSSR